MRKAGTIWLAMVLLSPLASQADDVDVPELGVRLTALPSSADKPQVSGQPAGYEVTTRVGTAVLSIYRENDPAPIGSNVADPSYRTKLDAKFGTRFESKTAGAPTVVGGHSAWTMVEASEGQSPTLYTCVSYVIVDEHLYRLTVTAAGSERRPPEFDSLVAALSGVKFEAVRRPDLPATQIAATSKRSYALNRLRAGRNDREDDLRGLRASDVNAVSRDPLSARPSFGLPGVRVGVETREVAA
jgi:hypothetical protein